MAQWQANCQFCGEERSGSYIPPDSYALSHGLPISYSGGQLCRCIKCGALYCPSCAMKSNDCCPKCGEDKWQHAVYGIARGTPAGKGMLVTVLIIAIPAVVVWLVMR